MKIKFKKINGWIIFKYIKWILFHDVESLKEKLEFKILELLKNVYLLYLKYLVTFKYYYALLYVKCVHC